MDFLIIKKKIHGFKKSLIIDGDKSLSIRWALLSSQSSKKCRSSNLLLSDDVINTLNCLKKLGVKIKIKNNFCVIYGLGLNCFKYKKNLVLDAGNSTFGRLILGLLIIQKKTSYWDKSLSKGFYRVTEPKKFGANFKLIVVNYQIKGTNNSVPIYNEIRTM